VSLWARDLASSDPALPAHLYVHVPFCASKCDYCDFASVAGAGTEIVSAVFAGMRTQVVGWERSGLDGVIDTIYFGGGTPSLHADKVADLLGFIRRTLVVHPAAEITVEANPDSLDVRAVERLAVAGANRISLGVQSLSDRELRILGRRHDSAQALAACRSVVRAGLDLSIDLMCAIPGQTRSSWADTLRRAASCGASHVSVYPLSIEDATPMAVAVDAGLLEEQDPDIAAEHMVLAAESLGYHGFDRYEVANYATDVGHRSRHNTAYWTGRPYMGIGPGAHGMVDFKVAEVAGLVTDGAPGSRVRYANAESIDDWLVGRGDELEVLTQQEALREDAMLGLRMTDGISQQLAEEAAVTRELEELEHEGLVEHVEGRWRTTHRGWLLGNEVFGRIWGGR